MAYQEVTCMIFFKHSFFEYFFCLFSAFPVSVNEVNSYLSQLSSSVINFQEKTLIFKYFQVPFKRHFKFQHFKEFKNLQGSYLERLGSGILQYQPTKRNKRSHFMHSMISKDSHVLLLNTVGILRRKGGIL